LHELIVTLVLILKLSAMRKNLYLAFCLMLSFLSANVYAQCGNGRYVDQIFGVSKSTVTYSAPYGLQMDIYQPTGDTLSHRPVIVLAHGGSFISGTRSDDNTIDSLCVRFAKRGYVTASIDYRLAGTADMISPDSTVPISEVVKAISDGKAALRYFVKDAATTNTYKVDTNNIYAGGNSAGAVLYMHVGYCLSMSEYPSYISDTVNVHGGFEGESGNSGYTTRCRGIIDCAGGLNRSTFVNSTDLPSVNFQGTSDNVVPYNCAHALNGFCPVTLCGMGALEGAMTAAGVYHMTHVFPGDSHVPWSSDAGKFKTVDSLTTVFLYSLVCANNLSVNEVSANPTVQFYPNPAGEMLNISTTHAVQDVVITDAMGRVVTMVKNVGGNNLSIPTERMATGLYFARVVFESNGIAPVTQRFVVE
jgi:dienelactone hydrolase